MIGMLYIKSTWLFVSIEMVSINISNLVILPNNVKIHAHLTKIDLVDFLVI